MGRSPKPLSKEHEQPLLLFGNATGGINLDRAYVAQTEQGVLLRDFFSYYLRSLGLKFLADCQLMKYVFLIAVVSVFVCEES